VRILHLDSGTLLRGGQWQALRLVEGLAAAGHDVTLLAPKGSPLIKAAAKRKLSAVPISGARLYFAEPDLVHAHDARSHTLAALFARVPFVVSRRVAFPAGEGRLSRWKYSRPARFIAVSEFVKRGLVEYGVPAERISVVYDGVPLLEPARGGDRILACAEKAGPLLAEAAALAGQTVHIATDLERDLATARLFVYISECEGLGSAVLMALSAGVPVVASRVGGIPEIIEDGRTGLLVDNTPAAIASAMRRMLDDPEFAAACGERGRQLVKEKFSVAAMVQNTLRVYRQVLKC
jgi:glycosyltransferase involved in cell wall biosynthesis